MTTIVDRRHSAPPTDDPEAESDRMARRAAVREAAARRDIELQPALLAEADIKASEARCDQLADEHARTCAPWQEELQTLEQRAIERIGRREPPDEDEDSRRTELTKLIAEATSELEQAIESERDLQATARCKGPQDSRGTSPSRYCLDGIGQAPFGFASFAC